MRNECTAAVSHLCCMSDISESSEAVLYLYLTSAAAAATPCSPEEGVAKVVSCSRHAACFTHQAIAHHAFVTCCNDTWKHRWREQAVLQFELTADCERHGTRCCAAAYYVRASPAKDHLQLYSVVCIRLHMAHHLPTAVLELMLIAAAASLDLCDAVVNSCQQTLKSAGAFSLANNTSLRASYKMPRLRAPPSDRRSAVRS